jgi:hypothetical protein
MNKTEIIVTKSKVKAFILQKKALDKKRCLLRNQAESWKSGIYFANNLSIGKHTWIYKNKFDFLLLSKTAGFRETINITKIGISDYSRLNLFVTLKYKNFFFFFPLNLLTLNGSRNSYFGKHNHSITIYECLPFWVNFPLNKLVSEWFKRICKNSFSFSFLKSKYKGKNYRWHRRKKGLTLRFGHSHLIARKKPISVFLKKKGRMKMIFFGTNIQLLILYLRSIIKWKPSNVYTGRGLRLSRHKLLKKAGKVSIYR